MRFETFREKINQRYAPSEVTRIERAYAFADEGHAGQTRADGSPYIQHPVAVADILLELGLPSETIAAALLHDVVEDNDGISIEDVAREFGEEIARKVDGVTKLTELPRVSRAGEVDDEPMSEATLAKLRRAETIRKTMLAMNDDVQVVLIKLADRLHNMRTLGNLPVTKQRRIALETMEIFAPLANRLGIWQLKWELEDRSFRVVEPEKYREISEALAEKRTSRESSITRIIEQLQDALREHGLTAEITGRPKHIYSIYRKMQKKEKSLDQIYDVRALRVMVENEIQCYQVLGVVHALWRPLGGEFDDYIAAPKDNFYKSLHTAVLYDDGKTLEVQIRTHEMHRDAEYGIAAHWRYKEGGSRHDKNFEQRINYLRSMLDWQKEVQGEEFLDALKTDVFLDRVYVFTPRGDVIDLPMGSTPIDFAYHVHTEVGHRCRGARVNGRMVALNYQLKNGEQVEVVTAKRGGPSRDWLNPGQGYVFSTRAREKIRAWFRRQNLDQHIQTGRLLIDRDLKRLDLRVSLDEVAALFQGTKDEFWARVGRGDLNPQTVINKLVNQLRSTNDEQQLPPSEAEGEITPRPMEVASGDVTITGVGSLLTHMARCCNPVPGDQIVGYTTRGRGVTIHRADCPNMLRMRSSERERLITVGWGEDHQKTYPVPVRVVAFNRDGLMRDIAGIVADERINISSLNVPKIESHQAVINFTMDVTDMEQLVRVMNRIEQLPNVTGVQRIRGG